MELYYVIFQKFDKHLHCAIMRALWQVRQVVMRFYQATGADG
jgi:hypothetical protein